VVLGFGADRVERFLEATRIPGLRVGTLYNPFFASSDNLATCWLARGAMNGDFVLLNGDTLFEDRVLQRLLESPPAPITVTIDTRTATTTTT
jgi:choline kinase